MSTANLLHLNVDALFEQHSVAEIDIVQKKLQSVVEQKREELRTMVGERYRDLLQAADTIAAMRDSSSKLIEQIDCVSANCRDLTEQQLIGFKTQEPTELLLQQRNANKQLSNYFSTMVQIKLLTALPEQIWSQIDGANYVAASELFIFSRHISTGLQLDAKNALMQHLPVAKKQWEILKPFQLTIKQSVLAALEREQLSADMAVNCLLSLLLLEKHSLQDILRNFLQLRAKAFLHCLQTDALEEGVQHRRVKQRILDSLQVLNGTLQLLQQCFLENALLQQKLTEMSHEQAPATLALLNKNDTEFAHVLPDIIVHFRPKLQSQVLQPLQLRAAVDEWLLQTHDIANKQLQQLFQLLSSINSLQEIKQCALALKEQLQIPQLEAQLQLNLNFFERYFAPLIAQRVRDIISDSCSQAMEQTFVTLETSLASAAARSVQLWTEQMQDLPLSLAHALSEDLKQKQLLMRCKGYDIDVINICTSLDSQLQSIVAEVEMLLQQPNASVDSKRVLMDYLRQTAFEQMAAFLAKVKSLHLQRTQRKELLFVVRVCVALIELCPQLKVCFCAHSNWRQWLGHACVNQQQQWRQILQLLEAQTFELWTLILQGMLQELHCSEHMPLQITADVMLQDFAHWQQFNMQQTDEHNNPVQSTFRIPNQPSISLQTHLFAIIQLLNQAIPQTLPHKVLAHFNRLLLTQLHAHYEQVIAQEHCLRNNQNVAIQLSFDIRFLQSIFQLSHDERALHDAFGKLLGILKDFIDPFDYELFADHMLANITQAVNRLSCQLGVLTPSIATQAVTAMPSVSQDKDPNVLSLSSCGSTALWFPLLPIITPQTTSSNIMEQRKFAAEEKQTTPIRKTTATPTTTSTTTTSRKTESSTKSKGAASSFFGAMSQEWFR